VLAGHGWLVMLTPERAPPHRDAVVLWLEDGWTCKHVSSTCCNPSIVIRKTAENRSIILSISNNLFRSGVQVVVVRHTQRATTSYY
jgi:hypothetical protein